MLSVPGRKKKQAEHEPEKAGGGIFLCSSLVSSKVTLFFSFQRSSVKNPEMSVGPSWSMLYFARR